MIIPPTPEAERNSLERDRLCRESLRGSLGWKVQLEQYSAMALSYLYAGKKKLEGRRWCAGSLASRPWPTLFF
jgi:hypothetical protein